MALAKLWVIAYRDLGRNRRRTLLTLIAVALGLTLLIVLNGLIAGVLEDSLQNSIRLQTGHLQIRAASYQVEKLDLQWKDLLDDPETLAAQAAAQPGVIAATPVLWAGGVLNTIAESAGLQIYGIDPTSPRYAPIRSSMVAGQFLTPDDRDGVLIGRRLADSLGLQVGQRTNLAVVDSNGQPDEATFTILGLFETGIPAYDESAAFMTLSKAQALTVTTGHASAVVIMLNRQENADTLAAALQGPGLSVLTWKDMNSVLLESVQTGMSFYIILDGIVMLVVAVIIANTLLMGVFERTREVGILAALGMRARQIMTMFLLQALIMGLVGAFVGVLLGALGISYLSQAGIPIGDMGTAAGGMALGTVMYARFVPSEFVSLTAGMLVILGLASLYPAWFAARLQPVDALHAL